MKKEVLVKAVRKAKAKGYSDQEIMKQFSKKIPKKEIKGALQKKKFHWIYLHIQHKVCHDESQLFFGKSLSKNRHHMLTV